MPSLRQGGPLGPGVLHQKEGGGGSRIIKPERPDSAGDIGQQQI